MSGMDSPLANPILAPEPMAEIERPQSAPRSGRRCLRRVESRHDRAVESKPVNPRMNALPSRHATLSWRHSKPTVSAP